MIFQDETINRIIFHYNKQHNKDNTIPTWIVKHKGQTYYVNHVSSKIGFKTKETPDSEHTKGSIQFKGKLKIYKENETTVAEIY